VNACASALAIDSTMSAAHNNLALAYAVMGDMTRAEQAFGANGDRAAQLYNTGIVLLARKQFRSAVEAFTAAQTERPSMTLARVRASQAAAQLIAQHPQ
jgi:hypothetical protein